MKGPLLSPGVPPDPVGTVVGQFLEELLDGIEVELVHWLPEAESEPPINELDHRDVARRQGPQPWASRLEVNLRAGIPTLYGVEIGPFKWLPHEFASIPRAAIRAAEAIGVAAGFDGRTLTKPLGNALRESIVVELIVDRFVEVSGTEGARPAALIADVISRVEEIAASTVEGESLSHGVVLHANALLDPTGHRYPTDFHQKRAPLLFDGVRSCLLLDVDGNVTRELTPQNVEARLEPLGGLKEFESILGANGSLVAFISRQVGGIGFYAHRDHSVWVYADGAPFLVKRFGKWRAIPVTSLGQGIATLGGSQRAGGLITRAAVHLSLEGHGAILAIVEDPALLEGVVEDRDRVDLKAAQPGPMQPVHDSLDYSDLEATLVRLASIDGATLLDQDGQLLAYGAVVTSAQSADEGARTAAAKTLSEAAAKVVLKVSEDGPITVFHEGTALVTLLQ